MKRFNHTIGFFAAAALAACTGDFESFNTNPDAVQSVDKKTYITTMQMDAVIPCSDVGANEFQRACNLMGDAFGGYLSPIQAFNGGSYTCTYDLDGTDYNNYPFSVAFTNVMPAWLNLKYAYQNGQVTDDVFAVAEVIKVMALQRTTDIYGPIPVSNFGQTENPYESQETVYKNLLTDLNAAIVVLKEYAANAGDARPLQKVDAVYQGDYAKWLKLANSVKLRMAMRIRFVEPALARTYAEEAVRDGVMTASDDGAWLKSSGSVQVYNPLEETWNAYNDTRMGATIDAYMNGYADPRLPAYFKTCEDSKYHGVRSGLSTMLTAPRIRPWCGSSRPRPLSCGPRVPCSAGRWAVTTNRSTRRVSSCRSSNTDSRPLPLPPMPRARPSPRRSKTLRPPRRNTTPRNLRPSPRSGMPAPGTRRNSNGSSRRSGSPCSPTGRKPGRNSAARATPR